MVNLEGVDNLGNVVTRTTVTDADGNYIFTGLPAGLYTVTQQQPDGFIDGVDTAGEGGSVIGNDAIQVRLASGQSATANNFGEEGEQFVDGEGNPVSKREYLASTATGVYDGLEPVAINDASRFSRLSGTVASASGIRVESPVAPVGQPVEQAPAAQRVGVDPTRDRDENNDDDRRQVRLDDQHSPLNEDMLGRFRNWVSRSLHRQR